MVLVFSALNVISRVCVAESIPERNMFLSGMPYYSGDDIQGAF